MPSEPNPLREWMKGRKPGPFKVAPFYSKLGDTLTVYFEDADCCAEDVTPDVKVYRADDGRIVGVQIAGVGLMVDRRKGDAFDG